MSKRKCECDSVGRLQPMMESMYDREKELPYVNHEPNECKCTNKLTQYIRKGKKVWLCSCCDLSSDKLVN